MANLRETAKAYEPQQTLNIADLDRVPIDDVEVKDAEGTDAEGKTFKYKFFTYEGKDYRVPNSVIEEIQTILKLRPEVKHIKVNKSGSGLATRYKVDVLD